MITNSQPPKAFLVTGNTPTDINQHLATALAAARDEAIQEGQGGLLLTRSGPAQYTIAVSSDVPYGQTKEQDNWR